MVAFKEVTSKKVISFLEEIEEFKETFKTFAAEEQQKLKNLPVFKKGVDFYISQLNFNFISILQELDADIKIAKENKNAHLKRKEARLKEILTAFDLESFQTFELCISIEDNFKTMRDLPLFGYNVYPKPINFRFPTDADLRAMPKDKPIEAIELKWKKCSADSTVIGAI